MRLQDFVSFSAAGLLALVLLVPAGPAVLAATIVCSGFPCNGTEQDDIIDASHLAGPAFDIAGFGGDDIMLGSDAGHHLDGGTGDDTISGGAISDVLAGDGGDDKLDGKDGDDSVFGGPGEDTLSGGDGPDFLFGEKGDDRLSGGPGDDELFGGDARDDVAGDAGNDFLSGSKGNDNLSGGGGDDELFGYEGADRFSCGSGTDTIIDFNPSQGDRKSGDCENVAQNTATVMVLKAGNLGPQDPGDFAAEVLVGGDGPIPVSALDFPDLQNVILSVAIAPGSYTVHEIGESGGILTDRPDFTVAYSDSCSGTIDAGETVVCTITNTFTGE